MSVMCHPAEHLRGIIQHARVLVFDFDGTLVDSNEIKRRGFEMTFKDVPDRLDEIMAYCRGHHHTLRDEKFRYVYEHILHREYTLAIAALLHERFAQATTRQIIEAHEIPGAKRFLAERSGRHTTALLSSTPHEVLLQILGARGWEALFTVIRGAPVCKATWLKAFQAAQGVGGDEVVCFGDGDEDARAAAEAGCVFVAVGCHTRTDLAPHAITDFTRLTDAPELTR